MSNSFGPLQDKRKFEANKFLFSSIKIFSGQKFPWQKKFPSGSFFSFLITEEFSFEFPPKIKSRSSL